MDSQLSIKAALVAAAILAVGCGNEIEPPSAPAPKDRTSSDASNQRASEELLPFEREVRKRPHDEQIEFWIGQLRSLSEGEPCDVSKAGFNDHLPLGELVKFGEASVNPLLDLITEYSKRSEWDVENPTEDDGNFRPFSERIIHALWYLQEMDIHEPTLEARLQEILRNSLAVNEGKELWGNIPVHAADTLHKRFPGYPKPKSLGNNALDAPEDFLTPRRVGQTK